VLIERLDPSAECDGLVPDRAPEPVDVTWAPPAGGTCAGGLSDGTGRVAVAARNADGATWQVFAADGSQRGSFSAWPLVSEPSGWHGLTVEPGQSFGPLVTHHAFSPDGALLVSTPANSVPDQANSDAWALAQDPKGGSFTDVGETDGFHNHFTILEAQRFDAAGKPRWSPSVRFGGNQEHSFDFVGAGVSTLGEVAAIWSDSAFVDVVWLDATGAVVAGATRQEFASDALGPSATPPSTVELVPLLDGGLAVRANGVFQSQYPHLATATAPLPAWLAARAAQAFRITRGNLGYAVFPQAGEVAPSCDQVIELLAPSGRLCGRVTLQGAGSTCTTGEVDQGWDGTVVQERAQAGCAWRFWPGLLAR
jgi:hypothetical protein